MENHYGRSSIVIREIGPEPLTDSDLIDAALQARGAGDLNKYRMLLGVIGVIASAYRDTIPRWFLNQ